MNREMKKEQLKKKMVSVDRSRDSDDEARRMKKKLHLHSKRVFKRRVRLVLLIVLLIGGGSFGIKQFRKNHQYADYTVSWEKQLEYSEGSFVQYIDFGSNVLRYSKDGASYLDESGKVAWMQSFEINTPVAVSSGEYVAVADQGGNKIYIFNQDGPQGIATTLLPIMKISISQKGLVAAVLEDNKSDQITLFKKDGTALDIGISGRLTGEIGYPFDIALSPDGTQLVGSYLYLASGKLKNRVAFHNFSEVGKNISNRLVGGFDESYENSLAAKVLFLTDHYACTIADSGLAFYSLQNVMSPALLQEVVVEEKINSIFYSDEYVGFVVETDAGEFPSRFEVYKKNGTKVVSKEFQYNYTNVEISGQNILLYDENSCRIYNLAGTLIFEHTFDFNIIKIKSGRVTNRFIVIGSNMIAEIKLQ